MRTCTWHILNDHSCLHLACPEAHPHWQASAVVPSKPFCKPLSHFCRSRSGGTVRIRPAHEASQNPTNVISSAGAIAIMPAFQKVVSKRGQCKWFVKLNDLAVQRLKWPMRVFETSAPTKVPGAGQSAEASRHRQLPYAPTGCISPTKPPLTHPIGQHCSPRTGSGAARVLSNDRLRLTAWGM